MGYVVEQFEIRCNKMRGWLPLKLIILIGIYINFGAAVKITSLKVPLDAPHEAPMDCRYDLEGSQLYDVKWYKDGMQFFRCLANGSVQVYPEKGIKIYHDQFVRIGTCPMTLFALNSNSAGEYKCEVTVEGPPFHTTVQSAKFRFIQWFRIQDVGEDITDVNKYEDIQNSADLYSQGCTTFVLLLFMIVCIT